MFLKFQSKCENPPSISNKHTILFRVCTGFTLFFVLALYISVKGVTISNWWSLASHLCKFELSHVTKLSSKLKEGQWFYPGARCDWNNAQRSICVFLNHERWKVRLTWAVESNFKSNLISLFTIKALTYWVRSW